MNDFVQVAKAADIPVGKWLCEEVQDRYIVIVHLEEGFFCIDDVCTHDGGPLGDGTLEGNCLVCPRHGAEFDVRTGEALKMPATEPSTKHEVRVEGENILVRLND